MKKKKVLRWLLPALLWAVLAAAAWLSPPKDISQAERRPLAQFPQLTPDAVLSGKFMTGFESYSLDQFPLRDTFRQIKSVFHCYGLGQKDNNGIYLAQGYGAKQEYPLDETSLNHALSRFEGIYSRYLQPHGSKVVAAVVPDKGYYLARESGHLALDYEALFQTIREGMPWAEHVDLTGTLALGSYYRTDTHWRQEALPDTARVLCDALGVTAPSEEAYTLTELTDTFCGVYYGQAALPMEPDRLCILESELLQGCSVYDHESGSYGSVYDLQKLSARDPYDVFLSGARSLLTIENPAASTDRELIVFRDSFGSSLVPLLVQDYARVTLVDIRYVQSGLLDRFLDFHGQDVLFLYSTLVLNNSETIK